MKNKTKNPKGFIGIIALLIVVVMAVAWMAYLMRHDWFGVPDISGGSSQQKDVPAQLDDLRNKMQNYSANEDEKINDAMK